MCKLSLRGASAEGDEVKKSGSETKKDVKQSYAIITAWWVLYNESQRNVAGPLAGSFAEALGLF